jgi:hypothetical protein
MHEKITMKPIHKTARKVKKKGWWRGDRVIEGVNVIKVYCR